MSNIPILPKKKLPVWKIRNEITIIIEKAARKRSLARTPNITRSLKSRAKI